MKVSPRCLDVQLKFSNAITLLKKALHRKMDSSSNSILRQKLRQKEKRRVCHRSDVEHSMVGAKIIFSDYFVFACFHREELYFMPPLNNQPQTQQDHVQYEDLCIYHDVMLRN